MKKILLSAILLLSSLVFCEEINFAADAMSGIAGSKTDTTLLEGNAAVQTSTMSIKADSIELSGEDFRFITATGAVSGSITDSQMDFTCGKLKYDRQTKIARLEDAVHLVDIANEVTADAQIIEYSQTNETAVMQIEITIKQKENICNSAFAIYKKNQQLLEMSGNPRIKQGQDSFRAQEITLNLQTQEITLDGRVKGTVNDSKPASTSSSTTEPSTTDQEASPTEPPAEPDAPENLPPDGTTPPEEGSRDADTEEQPAGKDTAEPSVPEAPAKLD